jgi:hypothetical protein
VQKIIIVADCGVSGGREHRKQAGQLQKSHFGGWRLFHQRVCLGRFPLTGDSQSQSGDGWRLFHHQVSLGLFPLARGSQSESGDGRGCRGCSV